MRKSVRIFDTYLSYFNFAIVIRTIPVAVYHVYFLRLNDEAAAMLRSLLEIQSGKVQSAIWPSPFKPKMRATVSFC